MTPLEKVEIIKKVVTLFSEAGLTEDQEKFNVLSGVIVSLYQPGDKRYFELVPPPEK